MITQKGTTWFQITKVRSEYGKQFIIRSFNLSLFVLSSDSWNDGFWFRILGKGLSFSKCVTFSMTIGKMKYIKIGKTYITFLT